MDKNEIIERLERLARCAIHTVGELPFVMSLDDGTAVREAIEIIQQSQSELPWIPCKKQLPVEEGDYFVTVDPRYVPPGYRSTDVITWRDGKWVMADYFVLDSEERKKPNFKVVELAFPIIAWMPLPKEYQEMTDGTGID